MIKVNKKKVLFGVLFSVVANASLAQHDDGSNRVTDDLFADELNGGTAHQVADKVANPYQPYLDQLDKIFADKNAEFDLNLMLDKARSSIGDLSNKQFEEYKASFQSKVEGFINQQFEYESQFNSKFETIMNERDISSKLKIAEDSVKSAKNIPHISAQAYTGGRVDYKTMFMQAGFGNHGSAEDNNDTNAVELTVEGMASSVASVFSSSY